MKVFEQLKKILSNYTESIEITESSALQADLGLCSFDVVSIVTDVEDTFEIEISDREIANFITVKDILKYIEAHI